MKLRNIAVVLLVSLSILYGTSRIYPESMGKITSYATAEIPQETNKEPIVLFCPRDNCGANLEYLINKSNKAHCAFFDLDLENVIKALQRKNALTVVDADYFQEEWGPNFRKDTRKAFMHNKFCIFDDEIVWTGSFNPTYNGDKKNNNNVVIIFSKYLAQNYEDEFQELWNGVFGKGKKVRYPVIRINNMTIRNYFCPEDYCANHLMEELSKAEESIYFMTFSFTHDKVGDLLVQKHKDGEEIKGVFEKRQNSRYSEYEKLEEAGLPVKFDTNPYTMHHKVFIIDKKTVITGSMNPTMNGDTRNDENMLVITGPGIAEYFLEEFRMVYGQP